MRKQRKEEDYCEDTYSESSSNESDNNEPSPDEPSSDEEAEVIGDNRKEESIHEGLEDHEGGSS